MKRGLALAALIVAPIAAASERYVPSQYPTIQAAVDASSAGDTIILAPGLYAEGVVVTTPLNIKGQPGAPVGSVVLTGVGAPGPAISFEGFSGAASLSHVSIDGFGVTEPGQPAGLTVSHLAGQGLVVAHCVFKNNRCAWTDGGAVYTDGTASAHTAVQFIACLFKSNTATVHGAAIFASDESTVTVERCGFLDHNFFAATFYARINAQVHVLHSTISNSTQLCGHHENGFIRFVDSVGCTIGPTGDGYVDGGANDWDGPCPDCNSNGVIDLYEAVSGTAADANTDGVPDECQCPGDPTGNGAVDAVDLAVILSQWGTNGQGEFDADVNDDLMVDGHDLGALLGSWGPCQN